jgi:hypothetical protein
MAKLTCPNGHTGEYAFEYSTSTLIACLKGEDRNTHTSYYTCNVCHIAFMVVIKGDKSEVHFNIKYDKDTLGTVQND